MIVVVKVRSVVIIVTEMEQLIAKPVMEMVQLVVIPVVEMDKLKRMVKK